MQMATEKQPEYIEAIEKACGFEFVGRTKQEASDYISEYKEYLEDDIGESVDDMYWF